MLDATGSTFRTALSAMQAIDEGTVEEIKDETGTCLMIEWHSPLNPRFSDELLFSLSKAKLRRDLCVVKGIGKQTSDKLVKAGLTRIDDLVHSSRRSWRAQATQMLQQMEARQVGALRETRRVKDVDLMFCFAPASVAYLDIETTGLSADSRVIAIAIGITIPAKKTFKITQLFARDYTEEYTIVKRALDILQSVECIVTFNGKSFDVPVLKGRAWYFLGPASDQWNQHHVDLVHELRRVKGLKKRAGLARYEATILGLNRPIDVPSAMIPGMHAAFVARGAGTAFTSFMAATLKAREQATGNSAGYNEPLARADFVLGDMFRILYHNMIDVRSLHDLLAWALREAYTKSRPHGTTACLAIDAGSREA